MIEGTGGGATVSLLIVDFDCSSRCSGGGGGGDGGILSHKFRRSPCPGLQLTLTSRLLYWRQCLRPQAPAASASVISGDDNLESVVRVDSSPSCSGNSSCQSRRGDGTGRGSISCHSDRVIKGSVL